MPVRCVIISVQRQSKERVLSDHGYADDAFRLFVQPEMPGWAHWLQSGDGTLREKWDAVTHRTPQGEIHVSWKRVNGRPEVTYSVPDGVEVEE